MFIPAAEAARLAAFEVGDALDWITWSDHVPLVAEFDPAPGGTFTDLFGQDSRPCGMMGALRQANDREVIRHEYTRLHRT